MTGPVLIVASAPGFCELCRGAESAGLVGPGGVVLSVACPHCTPAPGALPLPIVSLPVRQDIPRSIP